MDNFADFECRLDNKSSEYYGHNMDDKEGDEINLHNDEVVTCKKSVTKNEFIDDDADNIDL